MIQSLEPTLLYFSEVPEPEVLRRTPMSRLSDKKLRDLEILKDEIVDHIADYVAEHIMDDEFDDSCVGEEFNIAFNIMDELIELLPVDELNCERLLNWAKGFDDLTAYNRLVTEYTSLVPPDRLRHLVSHGNYLFHPELTEHWEEFIGAIDIDVLLKAIVIPYVDGPHGSMISVLAAPWKAIATLLENDWNNAFNISPRQWEEIIAGAFDMAGFDEVTLTPRSSDHGRDVIAVKRGSCSVRIIDSVKAYHPSRSVSYDDVRALLGVLHGDPKASKAILTTTSTFPPNITKDPFISPFIPYRLELTDGTKLRSWLATLAK
uniref:Restriction endonuclease n=1 Tax=Candidatus Kentrum sp. FM TaxID=2126340 RepID=A0A450TLZ8_9GAMM|nr:MAG: Restriction endonuclease [Candidatus Kentron sp. FM]VFJ68750.1 MAG: Restriction endonuclease [Candidatus Kentron sp. FM]VFK17132.1 MAG: Restriction endonuclease [Candidatus Kentron sp. FM]